jgi:hypothetical protein
MESGMTKTDKIDDPFDKLLHGEVQALIDRYVEHQLEPKMAVTAMVIAAGYIVHRDPPDAHDRPTIMKSLWELFHRACELDQDPSFRGAKAKVN